MFSTGSNVRGLGRNSGGSRETVVQCCKEMTGCFKGGVATAAVVLFVDKLDSRRYNRSYSSCLDGSILWYTILDFKLI